ncbi:CopG family transcriptional regulator [Oleiphilus sp. HI0081]|nr:CopG family transcriptional regulator [Oleiphilus sp. HI0043]KZY45166.1 CopG family transcriptional regulator [Oleiphilus sp. HI0050]KZY56973.1 CopG family transcriptional regulator [Oleiphilus sp. HI0061]KZY75707.1 CopG family transcriptional regulator [Oleiphilus sp. HI0068]KZY78064.1 CopG family transcriptional regulator [Oleiphilus sp. HI0069]KZZ06918.1 CopG family transcriptional regulator [Oleiphilus sp. HI0078]KZZ29206.1 CopG family transcriptional regulator [Oleiphilus sp. HI0081]
MHASEKKEKAKKNTSLRLDKKTLKALKIIAIEQETSIQKLIESLVKDYIKEHGKLD